MVQKRLEIKPKYQGQDAWLRRQGTRAVFAAPAGRPMALEQGRLPAGAAECT